MGLLCLNGSYAHECTMTSKVLASYQTDEWPVTHFNRPFRMTSKGVLFGKKIVLWLTVELRKEGNPLNKLKFLVGWPLSSNAIKAADIWDS